MRSPYARPFQMTPMVLSSRLAGRGAMPLWPRAGPAVGLSTLSMTFLLTISWSRSSGRGRSAHRAGDGVRGHPVGDDVGHPDAGVAAPDDHVDIRAPLERPGRLHEAIVLVRLEQGDDPLLVAGLDFAAEVGEALRLVGHHATGPAPPEIGHRAPAARPEVVPDAPLGPALLDEHRRVLGRDEEQVGPAEELVRRA